jgi:hypothetical protein
MTLLEYAVSYAHHGYEVLPLNGKVPLTRQGHVDATTDQDKIRYSPNDHIVIDVDPRNGGTLAALGNYPTTRTARTGSGGWHVWFTARGKFRGTLLGAEGTLRGAEGIDIKTPSGFVVMPPSIHLATGNRYAWQVNAPVAPLPEHLVDRVRKTPRRVFRDAGNKMTEAQLAGIVRKMEDAVTDRNNTLLWCACRLFERNADADAFVQLEMAALSTGLDDDEIDRTIESAARQVKADA